MKQQNTKKGFVLIVLVLSMILVLAGSAVAKPGAAVTRSDVFWSWDVGNPENTAGSSTLIRLNKGKGVYLIYRPTGLTPGNAITGWAMVFNKPELCEPEPFACDPTDMFHPDYPGQQGPAEGDFLLTRGHVIGQDGKGSFSAYIEAGDYSGSGLAEVICPEAYADGTGCTGGITNVEGALIIAGTHDHGPALSGEALEEQLNTYLGDCQEGFLGDGFGFALSEDDIPSEPGNCSTIQVSPHMPD